MQANGAAIEKLVNTVADRIGIAVEKAGPLAEEVVRQYQLRNVVGVAIASVGVILSIGLFVRSHPNDPQQCSIGQVVGVMGFCAGIVGGIVCLLRAVAPLPSILGL